MSTLVKISIQGIRSYNPNEKQTIKFQQPLTLILGQNGCGKTTIIECLKFVTCSDQPKNTNRGGFVWDPKLSDHITIKANVKLTFHDTKNELVVVSKSLESCQKLKNVTTKSLDQTLTRKGISTSHKCADIDSNMCTYMGVSKAILKDVIFCHQEDSSWPLDEDKKVKEKFDAIFDVGKYDKCIDQIRKEIKCTAEDKRRTKDNVMHLKTNREEARNKKATLDRKKEKSKELQEKIDLIKQKLQPLNERYETILYTEENLFSLKSTLSISEGQLQSIKLSQDELKSVIKFEFDGNDSDLDKALKNFDDNLRQKEEEKNRMILEKDIAQSNEKKIQDNMSKKQVNLGQFLSEEKQKQNNLQKQSIKITELGSELQINLPNLTEFNRSEVLGDLSKKLSSLHSELLSTQKEHEVTEHNLQSNIDSFREQKAKLDQEIKTKEKHIKENNYEINKIKDDVEQVKHSAEKLATLQQLKIDNDMKLKTLIESFNEPETKKEINNKKQEKYDIDQKLQVIDREVQNLQLLSLEQAKLDNIKKTKSGIENKHQILKNKVNVILKDLFEVVPQENIKHEFTTYLDELSGKIKSYRKSIAEKQKNLTTLEANYNHCKEKLRTKQRNLSDDENALSDMCEGQEYEKLLQDVNNKVEELQEQKGFISTSGNLFKRYIKNLETHNPSCPLCHRGFDCIDEVTELIRDLNMRVNKIPSELDTTVTQLETLLDKQSKLQQLKPTYTRRSVLINIEIPKLKNELETIEKDLKVCREELSKLTEQNGKLEANESNAKIIQSDVIMIDSYMNDIKRYQKDELILISKISESGSNRSLQEAITEQKSLKNIVNDIYNILEKKQNELNTYNEKLYELQTQQGKIKTDELNIKIKMQDEKTILDKLKDLQNIEATLSFELDSAKESIEPVQKQLETSIANLGQTRKQQNKIIENKRKEIMVLDKKLQEIHHLQASINDYEKQGWSKRIKETNSLLENLAEKKLECIEMQKNIQKEIDSIIESNANQEIQKVNLENNKKLRQKLQEEIDCLSKLNKLKKEVGDLNVESLLEEKKNIERKKETLFKEENQAVGGKQELDNIITNISRELMVSHYKHAEKNYLNELVKLEVLIRVENDLFKYIKAIESALSKFHEEHMQNINTIIKQLWRSIYTGNDIDYIQIKTNDGNKPISMDASKKRVYNYRIVQIKNEVELDMRGRCSAGQKVLACLIVRMALAETFSKDCGILALDEPTTNLDESNIQSLAESLSDIVTRRSTQKSFQLLIITHDPNFLRKLSVRDMIDTYYEVERNNEGMSIVNEKDIRHLP